MIDSTWLVAPLHIDTIHDFRLGSKSVGIRVSAPPRQTYAKFCSPTGDLRLAAATAEYVVRNSMLNRLGF